MQKLLDFCALEPYAGAHIKSTQSHQHAFPVHITKVAASDENDVEKHAGWLVGFLVASTLRLTHSNEDSKFSQWLPFTILQFQHGTYELRP